MGEWISIALQIYGIGFVIAIAIAMMIKGLSKLIQKFSKE